jgi:uncharacterized repeat protein (TIGR02543 family)
VDGGASVGASNMPSNPSRAGYVFNGWYTSTNGGGSQFTASTTVSSNITVYAWWVVEIAVPASTLQAALAWLDTNAVEGGVYAITLSDNESIARKTLSYGGKTVRVTLDGGALERTVSLSSNGRLFTIESGVTLALGNNVTLLGLSGNTASLVYVSGGTLVMNSGSKISGNTASSSSSYSSSSSSCGGGVYVSSGTFTMDGGEISGNTASSSYSLFSSYGGGVYVSSGTFTMDGGEISGNTASSSSSSSYSYSYGGGVYVSSDGTFTMDGGEISGNTASSSSSLSSSYGGGVYVNTSGTFTMDGGEISGNTASSSSSSSYGGGVYVRSDGTFTKQPGGVIYGSDADSTLKNTAGGGDSCGHAVYVSSGSKIRNTTAGSGVTLDSGTSGSAGGWMPNVIVQISLNPAPDDPPLSNTSLFVNESAQFSAGSGYNNSYTWYWNGEVISGAVSSTYTLPANSKTPGIYELSVVVATSAGETRSARCQVVIKAK